MESTLFYQKNNQMRPQPSWTFDSEQREVYLITDWSIDSEKEKVLEILRQPITIPMVDETQLVQDHFSNSADMSIEFKIRSKLNFANQYLQERNSKKYRSMVELFIGYFKQNTLIWGQVGLPHLILKRNKEYFPLSSMTRDSKVFSPATPLPLHTLGLSENFEPTYGEVELIKDDELFFLFHSQMNFTFFDPSLKNLKEVFEHIIAQQSDTPFCISSLEINNLFK